MNKVTITIETTGPFTRDLKTTIEFDPPISRNKRAEEVTTVESVALSILKGLTDASEGMEVLAVDDEPVQKRQFDA